jgi:uncharacterized membrane protein (DUF106 family)
VKWIRTLLWMVVFFCVILFSIQNANDVTLRFGLYPILTVQWLEKRVPLFVVLLCSLFLGVLIGGLSDAYGRYQLKKTLRQNQKTIEELQHEVDALRRPPSDESSLWSKKA